VGDDRDQTIASAIRAGENGTDIGEEPLVDIDQVAVDVEVADRCTAEALLELERIAAATAEDLHAAADVDENVAAVRALHGRRVGTDDVDGQRLAGGRDVAVRDLGVESQLQG